MVKVKEIESGVAVQIEESGKVIWETYFRDDGTARGCARAFSLANTLAQQIRLDELRIN